MRINDELDANSKSQDYVISNFIIARECYWRFQKKTG